MINKQSDPEGLNSTPTNINVLVQFPENKSAVSAEQRSNVERIAEYLKSHPEATCVIKGYASPDGNHDDNIKLADGRAESVKNMLITTFGIEANRIDAIGGGISTIMDELNGGRVSICEIIVK